MTVVLKVSIHSEAGEDPGKATHSCGNAYILKVNGKDSSPYLRGQRKVTARLAVTEPEIRVKKDNEFFDE